MSTLMDIPKDLLEDIALQSGASGYFLCLVCKSLAGVRSDIFGRTKSVLLEGNVDLFNELPNRDRVRLKHAIKSNSLDIVRLLDVRGEYINPATVKKKYIRSLIETGDIGVLETLDTKSISKSSALLVLTAGTNHLERIKYLLSRGATLENVNVRKANLNYETLDWLRDNTTLSMRGITYWANSDDMFLWKIDNGLEIEEVLTKRYSDTERCLRVISNKRYREWVNCRYVTCDDQVARLLINYTKKRHTNLPSFTRARHLEWIINECYQSEDKWLLAQDTPIDVNDIVASVIREGHVRLVQECINKFGRELVMSYIRITDVRLPIAQELHRQGYVFTADHLDSMMQIHTCKDAYNWIKKLIGQ